MTTTAQKFASTAFDQVNSIKEKGDTYCQKYGSISHKLPILIRKSGLAQAFAFLQAKKEQAYDELLNHIALAIEWPNAPGGKELAELSRSADLDLDAYILLTRRISTALIWYKRFAETVLDVKSVDETPDGGE